MRFQITQPWPCGQYLIPQGTIIDRASNDPWSQFASGYIPPPSTIALDSAATNMLTTVYSFNLLPSGYTKEVAVAPNVNNF